MYHSQIINENLNLLRPQIIFRDAPIRFDLREFSVSECEQYSRDLNTFVDLDIWREKQKVEFKKDDAGNPLEIPKELLMFAENERNMCQYSWPYWAERYYMVSSAETNKAIHYQFNRTANIFLDTLATEQLKKKAIREVDPKARQVGRSTFWNGILQHRLQFYKEVKGILGSYEKQPTDRLSLMIVFSMERQPFFLVPETKRYKAGEFYSWMNDSRLDLSWGSQQTLGTGTTPTIALLSEVAKFQYPYSAIDAGLINAMHESPDSLLVLESTAEGRNDYWHNLVLKIQKRQESGSTSFIVSFTPWYVREDLYPLPSWITARSMAYENFIPNEETLLHAKSAEATVKSDFFLRKHLGSNWVMPREQLFYYQLRKEEAEQNGKLHIFLQEMPSNLEEAFQHAGSSIYPVKVINSIETNANARIPEIYKLSGDSSEVPIHLQPTFDEIDNAKPKI